MAGPPRRSSHPGWEKRSKSAPASLGIWRLKARIDYSQHKLFSGCLENRCMCVYRPVIEFLQ